MQRFIPTAVGNASADRPRNIHTPVHPHGCGERGFADFFSVHGVGSSPRLWGTLWMVSIKPIMSRFIPTAVGNAIPCRPANPLQSVHPHGCGERLKNLWDAATGTGSSPRLWGTQLS